MNVVPRPSSLRTSIRPPIASTSWRLYDSPMPMPPMVRVAEPSPCWNDSNTWGSRSGAMPGPLSVTSMATAVRAPSGTCRTTTRSRVPWGVNLVAFSTSASTTCMKRVRSNRTGGNPGSIDQVNSRRYELMSGRRSSQKRRMELPMSPVSI